MKKLLFRSFAIMIGAALIFSSCRENAPIGDSFAEDYYDAEGTVLQFSRIDGDSWILPTGDESVVEVEVDHEAGEDVSEAILSISLSGGNPVEYARFSSLPDSAEVRLSDVASTLGIATTDITGTDNLTFLIDGVTSSGTYRSSRTFTAPFIDCPSDIGGDLDYVTSGYFCTGGDLTGTVTLTKTSGIEYTFSDWSFGSYDECYGGPAANYGTLSLKHLCDVVSVLGLDNYDDSWDIKVNSTSGPVLDISWSNDYGETGNTTLTRQDGADWPDLSN